MDEPRTGSIILPTPKTRITFRTPTCPLCGKRMKRFGHPALAASGFVDQVFVCADDDCEGVAVETIEKEIDMCDELRKLGIETFSTNDPDGGKKMLEHVQTCPVCIAFTEKVTNDALMRYAIEDGLPPDYYLT
jgi:hypothetical protein